MATGYHEETFLVTPELMGSAFAKGGQKMRYYRRLMAYAAAALIASSGSADAQVEMRELGVQSVTVIIPHDYPAFHAGTPTQRGRQAIELRAVIMRNAPWGPDHPAIILNPAYASAPTLAAALAALKKINQSQENLDIVLRADRPLRAMDTNAEAGLRALLEELQQQPVVEISKIRGEGKQITVGSIRGRL